MDKKESFTIGQFSEKTGISVRTLRYYDEIGLLVPAKDSSSGHRIYHHHDILTLHKILSLKFLGYDLDKISSLLQQSSFTEDWNESLSLHLQALQAEKEKIEQSMKAIKRIMAILKEEGEVDSDLLFSLISGLNTEDKQYEWLERHNLKEVTENLKARSEEELIELDKSFVELNKRVKELYGRRVEDAEVQNMIEQYINSTFAFLGEELMQKLADANVEEMEIQEIEQLTPSPFTDEEQTWLNEAMEYYMNKVEEEETS